MTTATDSLSIEGESHIAHLPFGLVVGSLYLFCFLLFGALLLREIRLQDANMASIARERGAVLFRLIEVTRDWNAQHGGVYVPVTETTQPNPYLDDPKRDLITRDGTRLTKINPAFMTRQIAEIAEKLDGVKFHITSLRPIRPANQADPWEKIALSAFETGTREQLSFIDGDMPVHRYMAPLVVKEACLKCHAGQHYQVGDIRGGISITMPASQLLALQQAEKRRAIWLHLFAALSLGAAGHYLLRRSRQFFRTVQTINAAQEKLIAERTRALTTANDDLRREVFEHRRSEALLKESEERLRTVLDFGTDGVIVTESGLVTFANRRLGEMLGRDPGDLIGKSGLEILHPSERSRVERYRDDRLKGIPAPTQYRTRLNHPDPNRIVTVDFSVKMLSSSEDSPKILVSIRDVTALIEAERGNRISGAVFENAAEAIIVTDTNNRIVRVNPAFTAITGYTPNEVRGQDPKLLKSGRHDKTFYATMWNSLLTTGLWQGEIWNRRKNGDAFIEWLSITRIAGAEGEGGYVATFSDITRRKEAEDLMRHKAHHDPLTDLPNRALFYDRLQNALLNGKRYQRTFALLYVDLDYFKEVNDHLGHAAGDALLVETSRRLSACLREADTVARLGGDEFAMILTEVSNIGDAEEIAQRALHALSAPFALSEGTANISCSIGIALFPDHGEETEILQRHADKALYAAKDGGRNTYRIYTPPTKN